MYVIPATAIGAPCVLASHRPSHPSDEHQTLLVVPSRQLDEQRGEDEAAGDVGRRV
jgi:hypothetical protein